MWFELNGIVFEWGFSVVVVNLLIIVLYDLFFF